ncbi:uncharacterized protein [Palaemon carinicauda]|uniref:uncharacterized protein n=1 Tax=Palaemon carinicauda TaxID=392227 RepID=UPI0035B67E4F
MMKSIVLLYWVTVIQGPAKSQLMADLEDPVTYPGAFAANRPPVHIPNDSDISSASNSSEPVFGDHSHKTANSATSSTKSEMVFSSANSNGLDPSQPSSYRIEHTLGSILTSLTPRAEGRSFPPRSESSTGATFSSPVRGDLPLDLDSEENTDDEVIDYHFLGPSQSMLFGPLPVLPDTSTNDEDSRKDFPELGDEQVDDDLPTISPMSSSEIKDIIDVGNLLEADPDFLNLAVSGEEISALTTTPSQPEPLPAQPPAPLPITVSPATEIASRSLTNPVASLSLDSHHNESKEYFDSITGFGHSVTTTELPEVITVFTSSPLQLHDKWTWFHLILRGDCHFVDLRHSYILFYDFVKSLSALLLYNREHIIVDSMTCSGRRMTVNMSIDSIYYPNCEMDLRTLLSHRNLRVDLHNASFYIHSYETKRTLMFETKEDTNEKKDPYVLYITLGSVGISLICIIFAGGLFALYQCIAMRKNKTIQTDIGPRYRGESPRSLCPKYEIDQSMSFSDQRTYSVNMYKSYTDLTAPDLYSHLGSPNHTDQEKEKAPNKATILTKIPKEKTKKKKKKKNNTSLYGLNDCETYQEFWSESITKTNEDYMTVHNLNTMTSSFKTNVMESDKDSLYPLLKKKMPIPVPKKPSKDDFPLPPPPSHPPPPPPPTTCPSSPAINKGVLERMDQLISDTYSNSSPDITSNGYSRSYSNTTINYSSASSALFPSVLASTTNVSLDSSKKKNPTTKAPDQTKPSAVAQKAPPPTTSSSADNLCLTRITFMEMCVWPQHSNPQLALEATQSKDHLHLK